MCQTISRVFEEEPQSRVSFLNSFGVNVFITLLKLLFQEEENFTCGGVDSLITLLSEICP